MSIGSRIKEIRKHKKLTILELKQLSGLSKSTISEVENGITSPTAITLNKFAEALNVSVDEFFKEDSNIDYIDSLTDSEAIATYEVVRNNEMLKKLVDEVKDYTPEQIRKALKVIKAMEE